MTKAGMAEQLKKNKRKRKTEMNERTVHCGYWMKYRIAYNTCMVCTHVLYRGWILSVYGTSSGVYSRYRDCPKCFLISLITRKHFNRGRHRRIMCYIFIAPIYTRTQQRKLDTYFPHIEL